MLLQFRGVIRFEALPTCRSINAISEPRVAILTLLESISAFMTGSS